MYLLWQPFLTISIQVEEYLGPDIISNEIFIT